MIFNKLEFEYSSYECEVLVVIWSIVNFRLAWIAIQFLSILPCKIVYVWKWLGQICDEVLVLTICKSLGSSLPCHFCEACGKRVVSEEEFFFWRGVFLHPIIT